MKGFAPWSESLLSSRGWLARAGTNPDNSCLGLRGILNWVVASLAVFVNCTRGVLGPSLPELNKTGRPVQVPL